MATLGGNVPSLKRPDEFSNEPDTNWCKCGHHEDDHGLDEEDGGPSPNCQAVEGDATCPCKAYEKVKNG